MVVLTIDPIAANWPGTPPPVQQLDGLSVFVEFSELTAICAPGSRFGRASGD